MTGIWKNVFFVFRHTLSFFQSFWAERKEILAGCRENQWFITDWVGVFLAYKKALRTWTKWTNASNYKKSNRFLPSVSWLPRISYKVSIFTLYVACFTNKDIMFSLIITVTVLLFPTLTQGKITDVQNTFFSAAKFAYSVFQFHTNILL